MKENEILELEKRVIEGYKISFDDAKMLLQAENKAALYDSANNIRKYFCGDRIDLCSITNAKSGLCSEDCKWCSQSAHHTSDVEVYDIVDTKTALEHVAVSSKNGVSRHSLVTSGRTVSPKNLDKLIGIYKEIQKESNMGLCASMGLLSKEQLIKLKQAGVDNFHCNLETAPSKFHELCTTHTMEDKIRVLNNAKEVGLNICSGGIIGMGETAEQRVELAFALRDLDVKSIPINILNPIKGTKLYGIDAITEEEVLTTIALFRFINPDAFLRFAGGRLLIQSYQQKALKAGINASIVGDLLTTIGSTVKNDINNFKEVGFNI
ncbi:MAG: biotin synthase BioB [Bacteroidota bacterium]|nr:biotin synthase BioB [Bacteroidota bacterium]